MAINSDEVKTITTPQGRTLEILKTLDLRPDEGEVIRQAARDADNVGGYLHIEIRRRLDDIDDEREDRFWVLTGVTNPDIHDAIGTPVCGLVDEEAGGVIAYVLGSEARTQALADVLNAAAMLNPHAQDGGGHVGRLIQRLT